MGQKWIVFTQLLVLIPINEENVSVFDIKERVTRHIHSPYIGGHIDRLIKN